MPKYSVFFQDVGMPWKHWGYFDSRQAARDHAQWMQDHGTPKTKILRTTPETDFAYLASVISHNDRA